MFHFQTETASRKTSYPNRQSWFGMHFWATEGTQGCDKWGGLMTPRKLLTDSLAPHLRNMLDSGENNKFPGLFSTLEGREWDHQRRRIIFPSRHSSNFIPWSFSLFEIAHSFGEKWTWMQIREQGSEKWAQITLALLFPFLWHLRPKKTAVIEFLIFETKKCKHTSSDLINF